MTDPSPKLLSDHPFWLAVSSGDVPAARTLLSEDPSLVRRDFRPTEEQDPHTCGFPLVKAATTGNREMVNLLLDAGADVDAKSLHEEQRELGAPIMLAFERRDYDMIHFLLDRGASVAAYGWCYPSLVDLVYEESLKHGGCHEQARRGFDRYLGESQVPAIKDDAHESVNLFDRLLDMGGQPSLRTIVELRNYDLVEQLLRVCPDEPSTIHDYPSGTVFEVLCRAASWHGIPKVLDRAMELCPDRFTRDVSVAALQSAIKSHNREGLASEYFELIETQLKFLRDRNELESVIQGDDFLPHFMLAENYLWPGWLGNEKDPSTVQSMIQLSELFVGFGFTHINRVDPDSGETALAKAKSRVDHPGLSDFAEYLISLGAK